MTETLTLSAGETGSGDAAPSDAPPSDAPPFDAPVRGAPAPETDEAESLVVNLEGYEGPLHVLLDLARTQKVDLRRLSMTALVDQYLAFVEAARALRLELAADYLVMASWLAYLKSKLLIPAPAGPTDEPTADEMAARLAFRLQRLEAMRKAADEIYRLPQFGVDLFARGAPEGLRVVRRPAWQADLYELLKAYARQRIDTVDRTYTVEAPKVFAIEEARQRLARLLGDIPDWIDLAALAPMAEVDAPAASVIASAFNAALEFAKDGRVELRQFGHYEPIYVRRRETPRIEEGDDAATPLKEDEA